MTPPIGTLIASVAIPLRLVSEANQRDHWTARSRRTKQHRAAAFLAVTAATTKAQRAALPMTVVITRIAPRSLDDDNLVGSAKATRDGIADALGVNDRDPRVTWIVRGEKGKPKTYGVRIELHHDKAPIGREETA